MNVNLYGKSNFAGVIKLRTFKHLVRGILWIIWVDPKSDHKCPDKSETEDLTQRKSHVKEAKGSRVRETKCYTTGFEDRERDHKLKDANPGSWERQGDTLSSRPSEENTALRKSWFWLSETFWTSGFRNQKRVNMHCHLHQNMEEVKPR